MNFYQEDVNRVWQEKLVGVFYKFRKHLLDTHEKRLQLPMFEISEKDWGDYTSGEKPVIRVSRNLLQNFGLGAAEHVVGHEMAHMIVDKIFNMGDLRAHGEAFVKACGMLSISPQRLISAHELRGLDEEANEKAKVVLRVKKLMRLSESPENEEAERALKKAHELMLRYNIKTLDEHKPDDYFIRPVGPVMKRMPNYVRDIAAMCEEYYFVNVVLCHHGDGTYYEFFGNKENLDIAEYIFCCLLQQGERLWERYRDEKKAEYGRVKGMFSKANYIEGVVAGYTSQLHAKKREIEEKMEEEAAKARKKAAARAAEPKSDLNFFSLHGERASSFEDRKPEEESFSCTDLVWEGGKLMDEMYKKAYPRLRTYRYSRNGVGAGFGDGHNAGKNLRISRGIGGSSGTKGRMLTA